MTFYFDKMKGDEAVHVLGVPCISGMRVRDQPAGISSHNLPCGPWDSHLGHRVWWQASLPTETPHHSPSLEFLSGKLLTCHWHDWQVDLPGLHFQENNVSSSRNNWKYLTRVSNKEVHCISHQFNSAHINGCSWGGLSKQNGALFSVSFSPLSGIFPGLLRNVKVKAGRRGTSRESSLRKPGHLTSDLSLELN